VPEVPNPPGTTPAAPTHFTPSTGLQPSLSPPVGGLAIPFRLEADNVRIEVVGTCTNILEALKRDKFEELYEVINDIMPAATSNECNAVFSNASAQITFFVPPRADMAKVLQAFKQADLTAEEVLFSTRIVILTSSCHLLQVPQRCVFFFSGSAPLKSLLK
jgi:hypothetical protein